nr:hypothetical protein [Nanoarchaeota archaeon]
MFIRIQDKKGFAISQTVIIILVVIVLVSLIVFIGLLYSKGSSMGEGFVNFFKNLFGSI